MNISNLFMQALSKRMAQPKPVANKSGLYQGIRSLMGMIAVLAIGAMCFMNLRPQLPAEKPSSQVAPQPAKTPKYAPLSVEDTSVKDSQESIETRPVSNKAVDDPELRPIGAKAPVQKPSVQAESATGIIPGLGVNLALVIGLMVLFAAGWRKLKGMPAVKSSEPTPGLNLVNSIVLSSQVQLHLVEADGNRFLLASTPQQVTVVATLGDHETIGTVATVAAEPEAVDESPTEWFKGVLEQQKANAAVSVEAKTSPIAAILQSSSTAASEKPRVVFEDESVVEAVAVTTNHPVREVFAPGSSSLFQVAGKVKNAR